MSEHDPYGVMHATTIITVRKGDQVVMAGDGQVSLGQTVMKGNARKVRRIGSAKTGGSDVIAGFAGSHGRCLHACSSVSRANCEKHPGPPGALEPSKWPRTGAWTSYLRRLEALLVVADKDRIP